MISRVTNSHIASLIYRHTNANLLSMTRLQEQVSSSWRVNDYADDPQGVGLIQRYDSLLKENGQYARNIERARTMVQQTDTALLDLVDLLRDARELAQREVSGGASAETNRIGATAIAAIVQQVLGVVNQSVEGNSLFGGFPHRRHFVRARGRAGRLPGRPRRHGRADRAAHQHAGQHPGQRTGRHHGRDAAGHRGPRAGPDGRHLPGRPGLRRGLGARHRPVDRRRRRATATRPVRRGNGRRRAVAAERGRSERRAGGRRYGPAGHRSRRRPVDLRRSRRRRHGAVPGPGRQRRGRRGDRHGRADFAGLVGRAGRRAGALRATAPGLAAGGGRWRDRDGEPRGRHDARRRPHHLRGGRDRRRSAAADDGTGWRSSEYHGGVRCGVHDLGAALRRHRRGPGRARGGPPAAPLRRPGRIAGGHAGQRPGRHAPGPGRAGGAGGAPAAPRDVPGRARDHARLDGGPQRRARHRAEPQSVRDPRRGPDPADLGPQDGRDDLPGEPDGLEPTDADEPLRFPVDGRETKE
ncbi:MAG: hypothetical protein IPI34_03745 [bacterium]|nr:hypothetical protein [bacterium]